MLHIGLQSIILCSNGHPGLTLTYFTARSNLELRLFYRKKVKLVDFSETIAAFDLNIGRCKQPDEKTKVYEYSRSRSFLDFGPSSFTYQN